MVTRIYFRGRALETTLAHNRPPADARD